MIRCTQCCMPDTKPDLHFEGGVCAACMAYNRRPNIDWDTRKNELLDLLERHNGKCIVPSSGGKDSTAQVIALKALGATPTVVTAATCHLTTVGRRNIDNLGRYAETIEITPNRERRKKLNKLGLEMVGDISWPEHVSIFTIPFKVSAMLGIPLMFYGENPQNQYGGPPGSDEARTMTRRWVSEFGGFLGLRPTDIEAMGYNGMDIYKAPESTGDTEAHFLGQYLPWDSHANAKVAIAHSMDYIKPCQANWWPWENQDNAQTGLHDFGMFRKYGYGRGCAQISVDVRAGRITRAEALHWVRENDGRFPVEYMGVSAEEALYRIGVTLPYFFDIVERYTDQNLFTNGRLIEEELA